MQREGEKWKAAAACAGFWRARDQQHKKQKWATYTAAVVVAVSEVDQSPAVRPIHSSLVLPRMLVVEKLYLPTYLSLPF